ncbi:MAG: hypothetical protein ABI445_19505 [Polyangia bacterium]
MSVTRSAKFAKVCEARAKGATVVMFTDALESLLAHPEKPEEATTAKYTPEDNAKTARNARRNSRSRAAATVGKPKRSTPERARVFHRAAKRLEAKLPTQNEGVAAAVGSTP